MGEHLNVVLGTHSGAAVESLRTLLLERTNAGPQVLIREAAHLFFARCGLLSRLDALRTAVAQPHISVSSVVGLEPIALSAAMRAFDAQLFQSGGLPLPLADRIASADLRQRAVKGTARTIAGTYRDIHALVSRAESGYENVANICLHSPSEVDTLLDVADG